MASPRKTIKSLTSELFAALILVIAFLLLTDCAVGIAIDLSAKFGQLLPLGK